MEKKSVMKPQTMYPEPESEYGETRQICHPHALLLNVLQQAIQDLTHLDNHFRHSAQDWFLRKEHLLPRGVGFHDILDLDILDAHDIRRINEWVVESINGTVKLASRI